MKAFALTEIGNEENQMIGIISGIEDTREGRFDFIEKSTRAIMDHFDTDEFVWDLDKIPELFDHKLYMDFSIEIEDMTHEIRVTETYIY
jgi:hypothetical protein